VQDSVVGWSRVLNVRGMQYIQLMHKSCLRRRRADAKISNSFPGLILTSFV
jgi:hypothetical protein